MKKTIKLVALALVFILSALTLASCLPPNFDDDKAIAALEKNGYRAAHDDLVIPLELKVLGIEDVEDVIMGSTYVDGKFEHVTIIYFEEADDAKIAWEKVKEYAEKEDKKEEDSDWTINRFHNMIWYGTEAAIKATY